MLRCVVRYLLLFGDYVHIKQPSIPTTKAHRFCNTQPTTSAALLRIQLIIAQMIPGKASAAFTHNLPSSNAKALSLSLSHFLHLFHL